MCVVVGKSNLIYRKDFKYFYFLRYVKEIFIVIIKRDEVFFVMYVF